MTTEPPEDPQNRSAGLLESLHQGVWKDEQNRGPIRSGGFAVGLPHQPLDERSRFVVLPFRIAGHQRGQRPN
jgi:hypothetical protein